MPDFVSAITAETRVYFKLRSIGAGKRGTMTYLEAEQLKHMMENDVSLSTQVAVLPGATGGYCCRITDGVRSEAIYSLTDWKANRVKWIPNAGPIVVCELGLAGAALGVSVLGVWLTVAGVALVIGGFVGVPDPCG